MAGRICIMFLDVFCELLSSCLKIGFVDVIFLDTDDLQFNESNIW